MTLVTAGTRLVGISEVKRPVASETRFLREEAQTSRSMALLVARKSSKSFGIKAATIEACEDLSWPAHYHQNPRGVFIHLKKHLKKRVCCCRRG